jgi:DNA repair exonuclease SbcCD ATPase subunit
MRCLLFVIISNHENLHYLKESGVYLVANVPFTVWSLLGDKTQWPKVYPYVDTFNRKRICLYHGPVHNAETDVGYVVSNKSMTIDTFDNFDMVMLGDIHRQQILQEYDKENGKPIIVYAGSFIQQNHGESPKGHGWCDWNLETNSFTFHEAQNDYGYYTLRVHKGKVPDYSDMPKNVRLRIFAGDLDQADIKKLIATIRKSHNIVEYKVTNYDGAKAVRNTSFGDAFLDIHDVSVQNDLIDQWVRESYPTLSDDAIDKVLELNKTLNAQLDGDDLSRKIVWKPISLRFDNLFTYGEGNTIDFTDLNGVAGIFAPNASGKTSIADAICFALYDRTPRTVKAANIMNFQRDSCYLEFRFEINGVDFVIERTGKKSKKGEVKIDVNFYRLERDGTKVSLNGEERRYTNQEIRKYVGDFEDFVLTTLSSSAQTGLFVDRGQSERKDLLSQFMGLTILDKLHNLCNELARDTTATLKRFKNDDFTQELIDVQSKIGDAKNYLDKLTVDENERISQIEQQNNKLQELFSKKIPNVISRKQPNAQTRIDLESRFNALNEEYKKTVADVTNLTNKLEKAKEKLATEYSTTEQDYASFVKLTQDKIAQEGKLKNIESLLQATKDSLLKSLQYHYNQNCARCVENAEHITIERRRLTEKTQTHESELFSARIELGKLEKDISNLPSDIKERYDRLHIGKKWVSTAERDIQKFYVQQERIKREMDRIESDLENFAHEMEDYIKNEDAILTNNELDSKITNSREILKALEKDLRLTQSTIQIQQKEIAVSEQKRTDMLNRISEAKRLEEENEIYNAYLSAVSRDGLPYKLISEVLPNVENAVNNILSQTVDFTLGFEMDGKNVNMRLSYDQDRTWPLELASGMEKFLSGLAIRVALMQVCALPKTNFLIVDEGMGALDGDNLASLSGLFDVLKTQFDFIFLISHVDAVRDVSDRLLEIKRQNGVSQITV